MKKSYQSQTRKRKEIHRKKFNQKIRKKNRRNQLNKIYRVNKKLMEKKKL